MLRITRLGICSHCGVVSYDPEMEQKADNTLWTYCSLNRVHTEQCSGTVVIHVISFPSTRRANLPL